MVVDKEARFPNSIGVPSVASFVAKIKSRDDLVEIDKFAKSQGLPLLPLGDGTNTLPGSYVKAVVAVLDIKGVEGGAKLRVSAGENWDDIVKLAVEQGLSGIESLSSIPGRVGASPIQNIGAYGVEASDTIEWVEVYDRKVLEFVTLTNKECEFGYRDSLFKRSRDRFVVTSVAFQLSKEPPKIPAYKDVESYFARSENRSPTLLQIREAITEIRKNKLPDPSVVPNCGSFFKNPFVSLEKAKSLQAEFPTLPVFLSEEKAKIPAGFLIEQAGFKGTRVGNIEVYKNNALVLTNPHRANFADVMQAKDTIQQAVLAKFGISLEPEVNIFE